MKAYYQGFTDGATTNVGVTSRLISKKYLEGYSAGQCALKQLSTELIDKKQLRKYLRKVESSRV
jgi:hypothetical protein